MAIRVIGIRIFRQEKHGRDPGVREHVEVSHPHKENMRA